MSVNPEPGWYADPADQRILRWWDGNGWTTHAQPTPRQTSPGQDVRASEATPDVIVRRKKFLAIPELYADGELVREGEVTIRWDEAEWFGYSIVKRFTQIQWFPGVNMGGPDPTGQWLAFSVGRGQRYRYANSHQILVKAGTAYRHDRVDEDWQGLVTLCQRYLEPRLRSSLLERIRSGERVSMGGIYDVDLHGIHERRPERFFPWHGSEVCLSNGILCISPPGGARRKKDVMRMTQDYPNAQLLPYLRNQLLGG